MNAPRYAIYFAPDQGDPVERFGTSLLGYDAETGHEIEQTELPNVGADALRDWTAEARRYGFHATLKAPFRLATGRSEGELCAALDDFALRRQAFAFRLRLASLGGFVALLPAEPSIELERLEADIVTEFEPFRAPLDEKETARRLAAPLSERQRELLDCYGYPYVLEEFRFHMTLTRRLAPDLREQVMAALRAHIDRTAPNPLAEVRSLTVFRQQDADSNFRIVHRARLS